MYDAFEEGDPVAVAPQVFVENLAVARSPWEIGFVVTGADKGRKV